MFSSVLFIIGSASLHFGNLLTLTAISCVLRPTAFVALGTSAIDLTVCFAYAHKGITAYGAYKNDGIVATIVFLFLLFKLWERQFAYFLCQRVPGNIKYRMNIRSEDTVMM